MNYLLFDIYEITSYSSSPEKEGKESSLASNFPALPSCKNATLFELAHSRSMVRLKNCTPRLEYLGINGIDLLLFS